MSQRSKIPKLVLVTGPSGAGRSTAIRALEDLGFEAIDNLPISLIPRLIDGPPWETPLALGIDVRNRDFSTADLTALLDQLEGEASVEASLLYVDATDDVLVRRYSETRRRHPLSPEGSALDGISEEKRLLSSLRVKAEVLIDTSQFSPHDLKAEVEQWFAPEGQPRMALLVQSFSYKRGLPRGVDMVFDCRFLRNPHWSAELRPMDGRDPDVRAFIEEDRLFETFFTQVERLTETLLPAFVEEGKSYLCIAFGCTGGRHRSVALTEMLASALAQKGWQVSKRHRELERTSTEMQGVSA